MPAGAGGGADIAGLIIAGRQLAEVAARESVTGSRNSTGGPVFRAYLAQRLGTQREECVIVAYLGASGIYIAEDMFTGGRLGRASLPMRKPVRRALDLDAYKIVLAHNHPSGRARASEADIAATVRFRDVLSALEIELVDHFIVAGNTVLSMREAGLF